MPLLCLIQGNSFTCFGAIIPRGVAQENAKLCLWNGRALFIGALPDLALHQQAAALVCVGLERNFFLTREMAQTISCRSALIGPQIPHALNPSGGVCAFLFFDPDSPDYESLLAENHHHEGGFATSLQSEAELLRTLTAANSAHEETEMARVLDSLRIGRQPEGRLMPGNRPPVDDERILHVIRVLLEDPGDSIPIEQLAAQVQISPSRLAHLFKEQVGVPIRMFRTWYRLKSAVVSLKAGSSLTDAALRAGFYDSAHFTNTFRETFGLSPSVVFSPARRLYWHVREDGRY